MNGQPKIIFLNQRNKKLRILKHLNKIFDIWNLGVLFYESIRIGWTWTEDSKGVLNHELSLDETDGSVGETARVS